MYICIYDQILASLIINTAFLLAAHRRISPVFVEELQTLTQTLAALEMRALFWPDSGLSEAFFFDLPSGKQPHNYGKSPFLMGKSTINGNFQ
jgi:hypothetical protein